MLGDAIMSVHTVILGAGQAAAQIVASLRQEGYPGAITVIGEEPYPPYQRPPLSKAYLSGELPADRLFLRPDEFWAEAKCDLRLGVQALSVDLAAKTVTLSQGAALPYTTLVFATGSRVRTLPLPGAELDGVLYLRGIADVDQLRPRMTAGQRLAVIGGGYIGLEVAAVARKLGLDVTVFEMANRVLARVASPALSAFYSAEHARHGVKIVTDAKVHGFVRQSSGGLMVDAQGGSVAVDTVLIGAGILPNQELAQEAGIACNNGILVDDFGRTSDASVFAAGDCANLVNPYVPHRLRLESVQNAIDQAKHVAAAIAGKPKPYGEVPWFWSDQYDLKLQIAGVGLQGDTHVVRGDPGQRSFAVFHLRDGAVAAVEAVNAAPEYMMGRRLIANRARVAPERLADRAIPMKEMA
jgi:3-phenylpropionate/trans-cinnamate dioxygenase ferredoxin reductase subunit